VAFGRNRPTTAVMEMSLLKEIPVKSQYEYNAFILYNYTKNEMINLKRSLYCIK